MAETPVIPAPPQPPPAAPEPVKKPFPLIMIWIIIFLLLATAAGFAYKYFQLKRAPLPQPSPSPMASPQPTSTPDLLPSPTADPTADWKTYTNQVFMFKYPKFLPDFKVSLTNDSSQPLYVIRQTVSSQDQKMEELAVNVSTWDNPSRLGLKAWLEYQQASRALPLPVDDLNLSPNSTLDGVEAIRFWMDPASAGKEPGKCFQACPIHQVYFVRGDKAYRIEFYFFREVAQSDKQTLDQILATFKFLK